MRLIILKGHSTPGNLRELMEFHGTKLIRVQEARILDHVERAPNLTVIEILIRAPNADELRMMKI